MWVKSNDKTPVPTYLSVKNLLVIMRIYVYTQIYICIYIGIVIVIVQRGDNLKSFPVTLF